MDFVPYPKTPRLNRGCVITEKIDGTNAQICISPFEQSDESDADVSAIGVDLDGKVTLSMRVGSRSRWITPGKETDNFGFAGWCLENAAQLWSLGQGTHFGEWYGRGIQRGYGLDHRRFALFNVDRWGAHNPGTPSCVSIVPILSRCDLSQIDTVVEQLRTGGSVAVPGFHNPEGVIVFHSAARQCFKVLLEGDDTHKGAIASSTGAAQLEYA
jgi:hypothetical protein